MPVNVPGIAAEHLTAGLGHICAILMDGSVACWGLGDSGQIGDGQYISRNTPTVVNGVMGATSIAAGGAQVCVLAQSGAACWGEDTFGQLADGTSDWLTVRTVALPCQ